MCFWPAKTRKNFELFEMHTCLWPGAQIWFWHKWRKLVTASLLLDCIDGYSYRRYWNEFFSAVFDASDWSFLVLHFDWNVCNWIPNVIWPRMDWFWVFFRKWLPPLTSYLFGLKSAKIAQFLLLLMSSIFSLYRLRGILVCFLKMLLLFSHRIS